MQQVSIHHGQLHSLPRRAPAERLLSTWPTPTRQQLLLNSRVRHAASKTSLCLPLTPQKSCSHQRKGVGRKGAVAYGVGLDGMVLDQHSQSVGVEGVRPKRRGVGAEVVRPPVVNGHGLPSVCGWGTLPRRSVGLMPSLDAAVARRYVNTASRAEPNTRALK